MEIAVVSEKSMKSKKPLTNEESHRSRHPQQFPPSQPNLGWYHLVGNPIPWIIQTSTYLAILCDLFGMVKWPFQRLSDVQLGDKNVTLNHLVLVLVFIPQSIARFREIASFSRKARHSRAPWFWDQIQMHVIYIYTPLMFNSSPLKHDGWKITFLLVWQNLSGYLNFPGSMYIYIYIIYMCIFWNIHFKMVVSIGWFQIFT